MSITVPAARETHTSSRPVYRAPLRLLLYSAVIFYFMIMAVAFVIAEGNLVGTAYREMAADSPSGSDFQMLYGGAGNVVSAERDRSYEERFIVESVFRVYDRDASAIPEDAIVWQRDADSRFQLLPRYYNPPFALFLMSPLTLLDVHQAYIASIVVNVIAVAGLAAFFLKTVQWPLLRSLLLLGGLVSFLPVYSSIYHAQPTILIALLVLGAFLSLQKGRIVLSAVLVAFTAAKPQWAVVSGLSLLRTTPRAFLPLAVAGAVVVLLPFLALGIAAFADYVALVTDRGGDDLNHAAYTAKVLSWPGFLLALTGSNLPLASLLLAGLTLAVFAVVMRQGDTHLTWAAAMLVALIVIPHSHPQDWIMAVPVAAFLLTRPGTSPATMTVNVALLLALHVGVNGWLFATGIVQDGGQALYLATPVGFVMLCWCALIPVLEARLARREPAAPSADMRPETVPAAG